MLLKDNERRQYKVELKELKNLPVPPNQINIKNEPQLRQNLILAHQIQDIIAKGKAKDLKQIAGWLNLSHVRICQITGMLLLTPEIQEEILFSDDKGLFEIPEYKVNEIPKELSWAKQKEIWQQLINNPTEEH